MSTQMLQEQRSTYKRRGNNGHSVARYETHQWSLHAAKKRHSEAAFKLGNQYLLTKDVTKAIWWYERAAASRHAAAQYNLGLIYLQGAGIPRDAIKGLEWITKAADSGDQQAQGLLRSIDRALVTK